MYKRIIFRGIFAIVLSANIANAQTAINTDGSSPDNSAMLDVKSNIMGFLPPRLTTAQRNSIPSPANGLILYNTTTNRFNFCYKSFRNLNGEQQSRGRDFYLCIYSNPTQRVSHA